MDWLCVFFAPDVKGGEFFTQFVFTLMASVAFSSRICDFLVIYDSKSLRRLQSQLDVALNNPALLDSQNEKYRQIKEDVEKYDESLKIWVKSVEIVCRVWAVICVVWCFRILVMGLQDSCGWYPLLMLLPVLLVRWLLWHKWQGVKSKCKDKKKHFDDLSGTYQEMTAKTAKGMDGHLQRYKAREKKPRNFGKRKEI